MDWADKFTNGSRAGQNTTCTLTGSITGQTGSITQDVYIGSRADQFVLLVHDWARTGQKY